MCSTLTARKYFFAAHMSAWSASIRGIAAMSHSSTSPPIRCWGWMFAHSWQRWYSDILSDPWPTAWQRRWCCYSGDEPIWIETVTQKRGIVSMSVSIRGSSTPQRLSDWGRGRLVLFLISSYKRAPSHMVLGLLVEQQQGLCKCSGKIKMTENAVLSSGSEGLSNTPVII